MIEAIGLTKSFDDIKAIDHITATIRDNEVFGLIGTNGAGKSTFLKLVSGILKPDGGELLINGKSVFEEESLKETFFYISDDPYYFSNATPDVMMSFYQIMYPGFDVTLTLSIKLCITAKPSPARSPPTVVYSGCSANSIFSIPQPVSRILTFNKPPSIISAVM